MKAVNPSGQWSEPVLVLGGNGLNNPSPLWDNDERPDIDWFKVASFKLQ